MAAVDVNYVSLENLTVGELIELLSQFDESADIVFGLEGDTESPFSINQVYYREPFVHLVST